MTGCLYIWWTFPLIAACGAQNAGYQDPYFRVQPENKIISKSEEGSAIRFVCVADNAYMIEWMVNGSVVEDSNSKSFSCGGTVLSSLPYNVTYHDDNIKVVCVAWNLNRMDNITSQPAVISIVSIDSDERTGFSCECQQNDTHVSPALQDESCQRFLVPMILSLIFNLILLGIALITLVVKYWKKKKSEVKFQGLPHLTGWCMGDDAEKDSGKRKQNTNDKVSGIGVRRRKRSSGNKK